MGRKHCRTKTVSPCAQINAHSSRSHCLLIINVVGTNAANGVRTVGKLTLCDLAGSERINKTGATGAVRCRLTYSICDRMQKSAVMSEMFQGMDLPLILHASQVRHLTCSVRSAIRAALQDVLVDWAVCLTQG